VGSFCDALDTVNTWYTATILLVSNSGAFVCVRYNTWASNWDEWLPRLSPRLAPLGTRAGAFRQDTQPPPAPSTKVLVGPPDGSGCDVPEAAAAAVAAVAAAAAANLAATAEWRAALRIGSVIDCQDPEESWYTTTIVNVDLPNDRVGVRYHSWGEQYDEWIDRRSIRLQPQGSKAAAFVADATATAVAAAALAAYGPRGAGSLVAATTAADEDGSAGGSGSTAAAGSTAQSAVSVAWRRGLQPGDLVDVHQTGGGWMAGTVVDASVRYVRVRLANQEEDGRAATTDPFAEQESSLLPSSASLGQWILRLSDRLAPRGTHVALDASSSSGPTNAAPQFLPPLLSASERWRSDLRPGSFVDWQAKLGGGWYSGTVVDCSSHMLLLKYHGWDHSWNKWLPRLSPQVAQQGSRIPFTPDTVQPFVAEEATGGVGGAGAGAAPVVPLGVQGVALAPVQPPPPDPPQLTPAQAAAHRWQRWAESFLSARKQVPNTTQPPVPFLDKNGDAIVLLPDHPSVLVTTAGLSSSATGTAAASSHSLSSRAATACGFAIRRSTNSQSATPSAGSAAALALSQHSFVSRLAYTRLSLLLERTGELNAAAAAPRRTAAVAATTTSTVGTTASSEIVALRELREAAHRAFTGESTPPSDSLSGSLAPSAAATVSAASALDAASGSSGTRSTDSGSQPKSFGPPRPSLAWHDSSGVPLLGRCVQAYVRLSASSSAAEKSGSLTYLSAVAHAIDREGLDVNHIDGHGRSLLLLIAQAGLVPRPGGFLFGLMELLCNRGANPNFNRNGVSVLNALQTTAGANFESLLPCLAMLRRFGLRSPVGSQHETALLRALQQPNASVPLALLERSMLAAVGGGDGSSDDPLADDDGAVCDLWACNAAGLTALDVLARRVVERPEDDALQIAAAMVRDFVAHWESSVVPFLRAQLEEFLLPPLAALVTNYIDGTGKPIDDGGSGTYLAPMGGAVNGSAAGSSGLFTAAAADFSFSVSSSYSIGDAVDVFDESVSNAWYAARVVNKEGRMLRINYDGWNAAWDVYAIHPPHTCRACSWLASVNSAY
jgi:hypothetical protein